MKLLVPESDHLKQGIASSLDFLANRMKARPVGSAQPVFTDTFHAWYSGHKNKLTTVPQDVHSVGVGGRSGA